MHGSNKEIHFERISLSVGLKVFSRARPQEKKKKKVITSVGLLAKGNCVWLTSRIKKKEKRTPPLSRRLSQVACLFKEEYFTIKMFLW